MAMHSRRYRAIWRWHFYAGLVVAPFLLILAVTGAIYLFNEEINDLTMPALHFVAPVAEAMPPSHLIGAALAAYPGTATRIDLPDAANRPAKVYVRTAAGEPRQVMVDPGSGRVLGSFVYARTLVGFADLMHGSLLLGERGDAIVELAAVWGLVLIATGLVLWWPRSRQGGRRSMAGVLWPRLRARGRLFWRDIHAVTGVWTVALIGFLLLTGLPWAVVQGPLVRGAVTTLGIGNEAQRWGYKPPQSQKMGEALGRVGWSQEMTEMPASDPMHAEHMAAIVSGSDAAAVTGVDAVAAKVAARGITGGYRLYLPSGPTGVYTALTFPGQPEGQWTLYFDRWSGALLGENAWANYGVGSKAIELGVQIHMGRYFGLANQLLMLVPCVGILILVVSGFAMWWRRRPKGALAAPPPVTDARLGAALAVLVVMGLLMPMLGISLLVVVVLDWLVVAMRRKNPIAQN